MPRRQTSFLRETLLACLKCVYRDFTKQHQPGMLHFKQSFPRNFDKYLGGFFFCCLRIAVFIYATIFLT